MPTIKLTSQRGTSGVKALRRQKLQNGLPFMINASELATNQCYLEYPNGSIKLVNVEYATRVMDVIKELTLAEARALRKRFHFSTQP